MAQVTPSLVVYMEAHGDRTSFGVPVPSALMAHCNELAQGSTLVNAGRHTSELFLYMLFDTERW